MRHHLPLLVLAFSFVACAAPVSSDGGEPATNGDASEVVGDVDHVAPGTEDGSRTVAQTSVTATFTAPTGRVIAQANLDNQNQNSNVTVVSYVFRYQNGQTRTVTPTGASATVAAYDFSDVVSPPALSPASPCVAVTVTVTKTTKNIKIQSNPTFTAANASNPNRVVFEIGNP